MGRPALVVGGVEDSERVDGTKNVKSTNIFRYAFLDFRVSRVLQSTLLTSLFVFVCLCVCARARIVSGSTAPC